MLRALYRRVVPVAARERVAYAREWGITLLNYALMRSSLANSFGPVAAKPHALFIEGTNICNARCVFCAYPEMERPKVTMTMETFKKAVDQYLALGSTEVDLTPIVGDPFVDKHLFERLDYLASRPEVTRYHFYTNAILMKPELLERLLSYGERFCIFCSFGGFDRATYAQVMGVDKLDEAVTNIRALIEKKAASGSKTRVQVNLRVPKGNEKGEFWEYLRRRHAEGVIHMDGVDDYDNWGGKVLDSELREAGLIPKPPPVHKGPCHRLVTGPVVLADGRVNACCCRDVEATLIIGDLKKESLGEVLSGAPLKDLLARHERGDFPDICKVCTRYEPIYPSWMTGSAWPLWRLLLGGGGR